MTHYCMTDCPCRNPFQRNGYFDNYLNNMVMTADQYLPEKSFGKVYGDEAYIQSIEEKLTEANKEVDQLRVQLAGCGVAAIDGSKEQEAKSEDFGWSPAYADVLKLRRKHDKLKKYLERIIRLGKSMKLDDRMINFVEVILKWNNK